MSTQSEFKTWAIVEVMGHVEYAGFVCSETVAGAAMLRIDVPQIGDIPPFTKYLSTGALYGITPCSEETARARAEQIVAKPFQVWGIEEQFMSRLKERGLLLERRPHPVTQVNHNFDDDLPF